MMIYRRIIGIGIIMYLMFSYALLELDMFEWSESTRIDFIVFSCFNIVFNFIYSKVHERAEEIIEELNNNQKRNEH